MPVGPLAVLICGNALRSSANMQVKAAKKYAKHEVRLENKLT